MATKSQSFRAWLRRKAFGERHYLHGEWGKCIARGRKEGTVIRSASVTGLLFLFCSRDGPHDGSLRLTRECGTIVAEISMWGPPHARDLQGYRESCRRRRIHFGIVGSRYLRRGIAVDISCGSEIDPDCPEQIRRCTSGIYQSSLQAGSRGRNWKASRRSGSSIGERWLQHWINAVEKYFCPFYRESETSIISQIIIGQSKYFEKNT